MREKSDNFAIKEKDLRGWGYVQNIGGEKLLEFFIKQFGWYMAR